MSRDNEAIRRRNKPLSHSPWSVSSKMYQNEFDRSCFEVEIVVIGTSDGVG